MRNVLIFAFFAFIIGYCEAKEHVENEAIYVISNLATNGSLTAESKENNASVVLLPYNGTEAQRWKAEQAGELWMFRLRLNENLILTEDNSEDSYLSRLFVKGQHRRWTVTSLKNKGEDAVQLINNKTENCLKSQGLNNQVTTSKCEDTDDFVWRLKKVS